jgi:hypothetical protein
MAYVKRAVFDCEYAGCHAGALYEVCGSRNQLYGRYCKRHAEMKKKQWDKIEAGEWKAKGGENG